MANTKKHISSFNPQIQTHALRKIAEILGTALQNQNKPL